MGLGTPTEWESLCMSKPDILLLVTFKIKVTHLTLTLVKQMWARERKREMFLKRVSQLGQRHHLPFASFPFECHTTSVNDATKGIMGKSDKANSV